MLTEMISPIEAYIVSRLVRSLELQATLMDEVQKHVHSGQSACQLDTLRRLDRLNALHRQLLVLYQRLSLVGATLFDLEKKDLECRDEPEEVPF